VQRCPSGSKCNASSGSISCPQRCIYLNAAKGKNVTNGHCEGDTSSHFRVLASHWTTIQYLMSWQQCSGTQWGSNWAIQKSSCCSLQGFLVELGWSLSWPKLGFAVCLSQYLLLYISAANDIWNVNPSIIWKLRWRATQSIFLCIFIYFISWVIRKTQWTWYSGHQTAHLQNKAPHCHHSGRDSTCKECHSLFWPVNAFLFVALYYILKPVY